MDIPVRLCRTEPLKILAISFLQSFWGSRGDFSKNPPLQVQGSALPGPGRARCAKGALGVFRNALTLAHGLLAANHYRIGIMDDAVTDGVGKQRIR